MNDFTDHDEDIFTGREHTPLRNDAFEKSPEEKIEIIKHHFFSNIATKGHCDIIKKFIARMEPALFGWELECVSRRMAARDN